jgi:hypothetical protein
MQRQCQSAPFAEAVAIRSAVHYAVALQANGDKELNKVAMGT